MLKISAIYRHPAVESFGRALREAIWDRKHQDYATLVELESVDSVSRFSEIIQRFLHRLKTLHTRREREKQANVEKDEKTFLPWTPNEEELDQLIELAEQELDVVRAALLSHALVYPKPKEKEKNHGADSN